MRIKQVPEDFVVDEVFLEKPSGAGNYTWFRLTKRNIGTMDAIAELARRWHVPSSKFGYAGLKDKHAMTTQTCSVRGSAKDVEGKNLKAQILGASESPISLGTHQGNHFAIIVRDIDAAPKPPKRFINYFGEQRFSTNNPEIGKALLQGDYAKAVELVKASDVSLDFQGNNFLGALQQLPRKLLRLFIHAYQSRLWNDIVREHELHGEIPDELPIVGFGSDDSDHLVHAQLKKEGLTTRSFVLKSFPQLSEEGTMRKTLIGIQDLHVGKLENDELNSGRKKVLVTFTLPPGGYATEVIRQLFNQSLQESP